MKTLYLLRHAKSLWPDPPAPDLERPLNKRGKRAAALMGGYFKAQGIAPEVVLCSPAARTRETLERLDEARGQRAPVRLLKTLYLAPPDRLLATARGLENELQSAMIVAHEPGIGHFALAMSEADASSARGDLEQKFPTGALAVIAFPVERWRDIDEGSGRLVAFVRPRDLETGEED